jgi:hypothetical protein
VNAANKNARTSFHRFTFQPRVHSNTFIFAFIHIMDFALNQPLEGAAAGPMQHRFEPYDDNGGYVE